VSVISVVVVALTVVVVVVVLVVVVDESLVDSIKSRNSSVFSPTPNPSITAIVSFLLLPGTAVPGAPVSSVSSLLVMCRPITKLVAVVLVFRLECVWWDGNDIGIIRAMDGGGRLFEKEKVTANGRQNKNDSRIPKIQQRDKPIKLLRHTFLCRATARADGVVLDIFFLEILTLFFCARGVTN
jgi:hypothetical protein